MRKFKDCHSVQDLASVLNSLNDEERRVMDFSGLPTFNIDGKDPKNTNEVFSWDSEDVLTHVNGKWTTEPRCDICGEANFNCNH